MTTGQKIYYYRKRNGMTLEDVAEKCGVQRSVVAKWEKDLVDMKLSRLIQLADIFEIDPTELMPDRNGE